MSQGELHALGLAVFLPRACAEPSPYRFVIIDDPVQSMDPAKVDGLAEALGEIAETRQVVVFTHDDRLPEAIRRLALLDDLARGAELYAHLNRAYGGWATDTVKAVAGGTHGSQAMAVTAMVANASDLMGRNLYLVRNSLERNNSSVESLRLKLRTLTTRWVNHSFGPGGLHRRTR